MICDVNKDMQTEAFPWESDLKPRAARSYHAVIDVFVVCSGSAVASNGSGPRHGPATITWLAHALTASCFFQLRSAFTPLHQLSGTGPSVVKSS
jgi:hypothetical protein